jgi:hypothetical protein
MNEEEWLECRSPDAMLEALRTWGQARERKLRLFGACCCRRIWGELVDDRSRRAVEATEGFADRPVGKSVIASVRLDARAAMVTEVGSRSYAARTASAAVYNTLFQGPIKSSGSPQDPAAVIWVAAAANRAAVVVPEQAVQEREFQARLLRDIIGNPFRPLRPLSPSLLGWSDGLIIKLAEAAYQDRELPSGHLDNARLAVLGDALEDAGCSDDRLLAHLRSPGPHVRGCAGVDAVLGKS